MPSLEHYSCSMAVGLVYGVILVLYFLKYLNTHNASAATGNKWITLPSNLICNWITCCLVINAIMVFNLLPMIVEKITGKKQSKGASSKQLLNDLSNSVKNNSGKGRRGRK